MNECEYKNINNYYNVTAMLQTLIWEAKPNIIVT